MSLGKEGVVEAGSNIRTSCHTIEVQNSGEMPLSHQQTLMLVTCSLNIKFSVFVKI